MYIFLAMIIDSIRFLDWIKILNMKTRGFLIKGWALCCEISFISSQPDKIAKTWPLLTYTING